MHSSHHTASFLEALRRALARRSLLVGARDLTAYRVFGGDAAGWDGVSLDRYGEGAVLSAQEGTFRDEAAITRACEDALAVLSALGVRAVYFKPLAKDRSRLGGRPPAETLRVTPRAGRPLEDPITVIEHDCRFEVRLHDGFSTGLFLDQRDNRRALQALRPRHVLNLFAYTCAFAVPLARRGAEVTNVDVSARALEWGRRNLALNEVPRDACRFVRMDARGFVAWAAKTRRRYDLVIVDPPTFGAVSKRQGARAWSASRDLAPLAGEAWTLLDPGGRLFVSTNARELCAPGRLDAELRRPIGPRAIRRTLPPLPLDFRGGRHALACALLEARQRT